MYQFIVDAEAEKLDALPIRAVSMHVNALTYLEPPPNSNLRIESIQFNGNIIDVEIGLRHPFLGMTEFTGFDVCGVLISHGSTGGFSDSDLVLPGEGDFRLLNPDGYTRWWNPVEFPLNDGTMFCYKDGLLGTPHAIADFTATLNGYKYFCDDLGSEDPLTAINPDNRGMFSAGKKNIRHYTIEMGSSGITFNYAIDASWVFPTGTTPWEAPDDFPPGANRPEAWFISTYIEENSLWNDGTESGGHLMLTVEAFDWFGSALNTLSIESPGNFEPLIDEGPLGISEYSALWYFDTGVATPAQDSIDILLSVKCEALGYGGALPDVPQATYAVLTVPVSDEPLAPQEFKGWAGFGYNAENISHNPYPQDFDHKNYTLKWYAEDLGFTRTGLVITEDYAYISSCDSDYTNDSHHLSCYDITDGAVKWTKYINPTWDGNDVYHSRTSPYYFVEYNVGKIVIGGDRLWCFNAVTGDLIWEYDPPGQNFCTNSPKYYDGKIYITVEQEPWANLSSLHCIDASDGEGIWTTEPVPGSTYSVPGVKGGKVYWGMYGTIRCLDANSGSEDWKVQHGKNSAYDGITIIDDRLYFTQFAEQLVCMDISNGDVIWEWDELTHTGMYQHQFAPALTYWYDSNDSKPVLCFRAEQWGGLHAVKDMGDSAELLWMWGWCDFSVYGSPVYDNGIVYFGEGDSPYLRGLDVVNGKEVFTAQINQDGTMYGCYGQPGFGYGKLVVSSLDGVYCLE